MNLKTFLESAVPKDGKKCIFAPLCKEKKCLYKRKEE